MENATHEFGEDRSAESDFVPAFPRSADSLLHQAPSHNEVRYDAAIEHVAHQSNILSIIRSRCA